MNLELEYRTAASFADSFLESEYPRLDNGGQVAVHVCAANAWDWLDHNGKNLVLKNEHGSLSKARMRKECLNYVGQQYRLGMGIIAGWLAWLAIRVIVALLIKYIVDWVTGDDGQRLMRFGR